MSNHTSDVEKMGGENVKPPDSDARMMQFTPEEQRRIITRIDIRLVLPLAVLYFTTLVTRNNLSSVSIAGMLPDLNLTVNSRYNMIAWIFFIPYVVFQGPAVVVLRKIGPQRFLSSVSILCGMTVIAFGFSPNWQSLMSLRTILGVLQAGLFPGCAYLLSTWYPRYELQKRNAAFFLIGSTLASAGGILAYGIAEMDGVADLPGWRWIFIMEGIITCVAGFLGYVAIVDFPEQAAKSWRFLTPAESDFVVERIEVDRRDVFVEPFALGPYLRNGLDLNIWGFASLFLLATTTQYAMVYFLPIILKYGMGFSTSASLCLTTPPHVIGALVMYGQGVLSDKYRVRGPIILFNAIIGLVGLPLLGFASNNWIRYFGGFLVSCATTANLPALMTYQANNIRGQWKRAFCSATLVGSGGIGGIIGTNMFRNQDSPTYKPGIWGAITANGLTIVIILVMTLKLHRANKRADIKGKIIENLEGFRYTL